MKWTHSFALVLVLSVAACGGHSGTLPTAAIGPSLTQPNSVFMMGTVSDTAFRPLAGATIEIAKGPSVGLTTTSNGSGQWTFPPGAFDDSTQFRATKEGYEPAIMPLGPFCSACSPNRWVNFALKTVIPPVTVTGAYAMTITVDPACTSFPEQVRARTYAVTLPPEAGNAYSEISPTNANFVPGWNHFEMGVSGNYVGFWFETLVEEVAPGRFFMIGISAGGSVAPERSATITSLGDGRISYCVLDPVLGVFDECLLGKTAGVQTCDSPRHTLVLTPR